MARSSAHWDGKTYLSRACQALDTPSLASKFNQLLEQHNDISPAEFSKDTLLKLKMNEVPVCFCLLPPHIRPKQQIVSVLSVSLCISSPTLWRTSAICHTLPWFLGYKASKPHCFCHSVWIQVCGRYQWGEWKSMNPTIIEMAMLQSSISNHPAQWAHYYNRNSKDLRVTHGRRCTADSARATSLLCWSKIRIFLI